METVPWQRGDRQTEPDERRGDILVRQFRPRGCAKEAVCPQRSAPLKRLADTHVRPPSALALWLGAVLLVGLWGAGVQGADWPMFRGGPGLTGVASGGLPEKPGLLWRFKTSGPVKSSAAIAQGRVFIGSDDGNVFALELGNGKKVWAFKTGDAVESSPLVLQRRVFVGSDDGCLYALEAGTGKLAWKYATGDKIPGAPNWVGGLESGNPEGGPTNSGIPRPAQGPWVLVGSYDFKLHCVEAATGRSNWVYETGNYINGAPAVSGGLTVFGGCDALLHVISLADGKQVKEIEAGAYVPGSAAVADRRAYFGQYENAVLCVDLNAGKKVWTFHDRDFPYFSTPAVTKDRVLFGGRDKRLHCVKREDGASLWSFPTRGKVDSSPAVCGDKVVVGSDDGRVYMVSLATGQELWSYEIGSPIESSPAVADGRIVIGANDGTVYCFGVVK